MHVSCCPTPTLSNGPILVRGVSAVVIYHLFFNSLYVITIYMKNNVWTADVTNEMVNVNLAGNCTVFPEVNAGALILNFRRMCGRSCRGVL